MPVESKENVSPSPSSNRDKSRKTAISICLIGILAGGVLGELLRESMAEASHQHMVFTALLNSAEVRAALASKNASSPNEMIQVDGPWARDVYWQDGHAAYFVLADGTFYFDPNRPPAWIFPMVLLCPVLGFLIPWGVVKTLGWIGVGYFTKKPVPEPPPQP